MALEKQCRYEVVDTKTDQGNLLNHNIYETRAEWASRIPSKMEDANEKIKDPRNKIYLR